MGGRSGTGPAPVARGLPMRVRVNPEKCQGHGRCYALAPDLFELDDYGMSTVTGDGTVRVESRELVQLVAANCPEFAVEIDLTSGE